MKLVDLTTNIWPQYNDLPPRNLLQKTKKYSPFSFFF